MVRHVDADQGCGASELHVRVGEPRHQPGGPGKVAVWFGAAPANLKACDLTGKLDPAYFGTADHCEIYHADDEEFWSQIEFWRTRSRTAVKAARTRSASRSTIGSRDGPRSRADLGGESLNERSWKPPA